MPLGFASTALFSLAPLQELEFYSVYRVPALSFGFLFPSLLHSESILGFSVFPLSLARWLVNLPSGYALSRGFYAIGGPLFSGLRTTCKVLSWPVGSHGILSRGIIKSA